MSVTHSGPFVFHSDPIPGLYSYAQLHQRKALWGLLMSKAAAEQPTPVMSTLKYAALCSMGIVALAINCIRELAYE